MLRLGSIALVCAALVWPQASQAQEDPATAKYRLFSTAQMIDNKCHLISFADREMINDTAVSALTQLPAVLAVEDPTDYEAYFGAIDDATAPIQAELEPLVAQLPCDRGAMMISQVQFQSYADIFAHFRIAGDMFQETASPQQMQMLQILSNFLLQSLGENGPQFEQMVEARKAELLSEEYTPEQSASMVRGRMNLMNINRIIQAKGYDLRWNAEEDGWGLWAPQENRFERGLAFDDPAYSYTYTVTEGETAWDTQAHIHRVIVLPGREYSSVLKIMVLSADPESPAIPGEARLSYGEDWASFRSFERAPSGTCPMDACFTYSGADLRAMREAAAESYRNRPELTLYQDHDYLSSKGSETLREITGLTYRDILQLDLGDIFPEEEDE